METYMPITMLTLCTHQILVELDIQVEKVGPLKEAMGSWIERICKQAVEPTIRRRVSASPEQTIFRSAILKTYLFNHSTLIPKIEDYIPDKTSKRVKIFDEGNSICQFLGEGENYELNAEEIKQLNYYLANYCIINQNERIKTLEVIKFKRAFFKFKSEIQSAEYARV